MTRLNAFCVQVDAIKSNLQNDEQKVGAEIVRRSLGYPLKLIANNAGVNGSVVQQKVLEASDPNLGYNASTGQLAISMLMAAVSVTNLNFLEIMKRFVREYHGKSGPLSDHFQACTLHTSCMLKHNWCPRDVAPSLSSRFECALSFMFVHVPVKLITPHAYCSVQACMRIC